MAGVIFWHNSECIKHEIISKIFLKLDYNKGKYLNTSEWNIVVFPKKNYDLVNWRIVPGGAICCTGTFGYKNDFYDEALLTIYNDIINRSLDKSAFWGSFIILLLYKNEFYLLRDGAGLTPLYRFQNQEIFSTSFAGLINCSGSKQTLDHSSVCELLTTGVLTGNQTLLKEIKKVNTGESISKIKIIESSPFDKPNPKCRKEAIVQQLDLLNQYIKKVDYVWSNYFPEGVFDIGITGGMDSRLLAALIIKNKIRAVLHTHWRKETFKNKDFLYANIFAKTTGLKLNTKEVLTSFDMKQSELIENFYKAYCLSDGVIRPGCYWDEQYSTSSYRSELTKIPYIRMMGFGGEQYRNTERLPLSSDRSLESWIKWEMMYLFAGRNFTSNNDEEKIIYKITKNLLIQLKNEKLNLNLENFKNYIHIVQSTSYRSLQSNMENRLGFCLNPFLDTCLSIPSLTIVPFLGRSLSFQLDLINRLSPEISSIPNSYGFNFSKGEPYLSKIGSFIWQNLSPDIKYPVRARMNNFYHSDYIQKLSEKHRFINELENIVLDLNLPLNFKKYRLIRSRSRMLLNLGFFIKLNYEKITI